MIVGAVSNRIIIVSLHRYGYCFGLWGETGRQVANLAWEIPWIPWPGLGNPAQKSLLGGEVWLAVLALKGP